MELTFQWIEADNKKQTMIVIVTRGNKQFRRVKGEDLECNFRQGGQERAFCEVTFQQRSDKRFSLSDTWMKQKQREQEDEGVLGPFQDERRTVWLGESEKSSGRRGGQLWILLYLMEAAQGNDIADIHFKRLTLARGGSHLDQAGVGNENWLCLEYILKESTGFADGLVV